MSLENSKKAKYVKKSTRDWSNFNPVVRPDLKKRNDKLFKALVDNLNRNTLKQEEESNSK